MDVETRGTLRDGKDFVVKNLSLDDLPAILHLQQKVIHHLEYQEILQPLNAEEYSYILQGHGEMIGIFVEDRLIAFRALLIPKPEDEYLGELAKIPPEERKKIIYSEISNVDPDYRGQGLQQFMGNIIMKRIDSKKFRYVLATVAPFNIPSLKDKFRLGMKIVALEEIYNGKLRYVFKKDLQKQHVIRNPEKEISVDMNSFTKQRQLLQDGYVGVNIQKLDGHWHLVFVKRNEESVTQLSC